MSDWKSALKADPIPWLLEPENPSVRYFTLTDLLERPQDDPQVVATKRALPTSKVVAKIFSRQDPAGFWESPEKPYKPKYKATYWQVMLLSLLGLDREDERVQRACEHIFRFQLQEGGFSELGEEAAREMQASLGPRGKPSKWVTLNALRVLKRLALPEAPTPNSAPPRSPQLWEEAGERRVVPPSPRACPEPAKGLREGAKGVRAAQRRTAS